MYSGVALDHLHNLLSRLRSDWRQLVEISRDALQDRNAALQWESFGEFDETLSGQITKSRDEWEDTPYSASSPLCRCAARLLEGNDTGSFRKARTSDHVERGIKRCKGGLFQDWLCASCPVEIRFYVSARDTSLEGASYPYRVEDNSITVKWRDIWCAKSHLANGAVAKYGCLVCMGEGKELVRGQSAFNTESGLVRHIGARHNSLSLPCLFMDKLHVTKKSEDNARKRTSAGSDDMNAGSRSDLRFLRE